MKKTVLSLSLFLFIAVQLNAQKKVQFKDITFDQALEEANATNKIVFVDVQARVPSESTLKVEKEIFTVDSIADFINDNCVAIKMDMGTEEGKKYAPRLAMLMYPVYVFHDKKGDQLSFINAYQIVQDPDNLLAKTQDAIRIAAVKDSNTRTINFEDAAWDSVLVKSRDENKMIFIDAYTVWCRPCIQMAKDVFTLDKVADFYNDNFINVSMDMEKGVGPELAEKYEIKAYPTYLFIDSEGNLIYKGLGYQEADVFIKTGADALQAAREKGK